MILFNLLMLLFPYIKVRITRVSLNENDKFLVLFCLVFCGMVNWNQSPTHAYSRQALQHWAALFTFYFEARFHKSPKLIFTSLYETILPLRSSCLSLLTWPIYDKFSNCLTCRALNFIVFYYVIRPEMISKSFQQWDSREGKKCQTIARILWPTNSN